MTTLVNQSYKKIVQNELTVTYVKVGAENGVVDLIARVWQSSGVVDVSPLFDRFGMAEPE